MGWYLRKSFGIGPLRLNLSKSGLGLSAGVTGLRIGTGPRGSYVHGGRQGLYYRQSLDSRKKRPEPAQETTVDGTELEAIESETDFAREGRGKAGFWSTFLRGIFGGLTRGR